MHVTFLSSRLALTKTFAKTNGVMAATPYPQVSKVTSHHEQAHSLQELYEALEKHAGHGHCLFNGQLTKPIKDESRAGLTARTTKGWVVFDFDKVEATDAADVVARYLPDECQQVSYIAQLSASMFRPDVASWSGHIFMLLKEPIEELRLKQWFEVLNFTVPALNTQLKLSDSEHALHWPLDRTVAYNSKLIFIAPPKCYGFKPNVLTPIALVKKRKTHLTIAPFTPVDSQTIKTKINELRNAIGLDPIAYQLTPFEGEYVLDLVGEVSIHGIKTSGDHYIRFNLNGGDSYAYFIDLRRPELVRNFKGEPFLKTEDAAPDLWKSLKKAAPRAVNKTPLDEGTEILAFYATNQSSVVKLGSYNPIDRELELHGANERAATAWLAEYGVVKQGSLPHMDLVFDPQCDIQYVTGSTQINTFRATQYMTREQTSETPSTLADIPPALDKILVSMLGNPTAEVYTHFINWLAYVFQFRKKTSTAWVLSGTEGTGKATFVKYILTPIFGSSAVKVVQFGLLNQEYNDFLESALFVVFEEADTNAVENSSALMAKLRHYITDDPLMIRKMRTDPYEAPSYANFIFNSNKHTPVATANADRRMNFAERQEKRLYPTPNEIKALQAGVYLEGFADVLQRWPVNELAVTRTVDTATKRAVHEATTSINQLVAEAVLDGDLQFFVDRVPSDAEAVGDFFNRFNPIGMFKGLLDRLIAEAEVGATSIMKDEDLFILFRTLIPDTRYFQDSKTWRKRHYKALGLDVDKVQRIPGEWKSTTRGVAVKWKSPEEAAKPKPKLVTPINKAKKAKRND